MILKPVTDKLESYLEESYIIDFSCKNIISTSALIGTHSNNELEYIKNAYEYVRDCIAHSNDVGLNDVTCKASEVLSRRHGICFAKSHLLAALLRVQGIPVGFCYQRLILDDDTAPFLILHGLNGIFLRDYNKWIRLDPRGNKAGVNAFFSVDEEHLAFPVRAEMGEEDIPFVFAEPDKNILDALTNNATRSQLWEHLPQMLAVTVQF